MVGSRRHPFSLQWDRHFYRDTARLQTIRADEASHPCMNDALGLAELYVRTLHAYFCNPISSVEWHDGIVVMRLRMPRDVTANIALYSFGSAHYIIRGPQGHDEVTCPNAALLLRTLLGDLTDYGLHLRDLSKHTRQQNSGGDIRISSELPTGTTTTMTNEQSASIHRTTARFSSPDEKE